MQEALSYSFQRPRPKQSQWGRKIIRQGGDYYQADPQPLMKRYRQLIPYGKGNCAGNKLKQHEDIDPVHSKSRQTEDNEKRSGSLKKKGKEKKKGQPLRYIAC